MRRDDPEPVLEAAGFFLVSGVSFVADFKILPAVCGRHEGRMLLAEWRKNCKSVVAQIICVSDVRLKFIGTAFKLESDKRSGRKPDFVKVGIIGIIFRLRDFTGIGGPFLDFQGIESRFVRLKFPDIFHRIDIFRVLAARKNDQNK